MILYDKEKIIGTDKNLVFKKVGWTNVAHRGYTARATMNTIEAFYEGLLDNCPAFECDVRETSDGYLVLSHDPSITGKSDSTGANKTLTIATSTYEELRDLTLMTSNIYGKIKIPLFDDVLKFAYFHDAEVAIDMKTGSESFEKIAEAVIKNGMSGRCMYNTNSDEITIAQQVLLIDPKASFHFAYTDDIATKFTNLNVVSKDKIIITLGASAMSDLKMKSIQMCGFKSYIWYVNQSTYNTAVSHRPDYLEYVTGVAVTPLENNYLNGIDY